jgi:thiol-disulfide isomerase/thioredoxin
MKRNNSNLGLLVAVALIAAAIFLLMGMRASPGPRTANLTPSQTAANGTTAVPNPNNYPVAPELAGISGYINTPNGTTLASLRGKVVLLDFWTYSCINCLRTLPYLNSWYAKYHDKGFEIIGVHTPEFDFEKIAANVRSAVAKYGIAYPVVQDNDYGTWNAYSNSYWPRHYLIDRNGFIRDDHIGEGGYDETEQKIVALLNEGSNQSVGMAQGSVQADSIDAAQIATPEIYFGAQFLRQPLGNYFAPTGWAANASAPAQLAPDVAYVSGTWTNNNDNLELSSDNGSVILSYQARKVNIVADAADSSSPSHAVAFIDGKAADPAWYGPDAGTGGDIVISNSRLYNVVSGPDYSRHTLELRVTGRGFRIYTFTFG